MNLKMYGPMNNNKDTKTGKWSWHGIPCCSFSHAQFIRAAGFLNSVLAWSAPARRGLNLSFLTTAAGWKCSKPSFAKAASRGWNKPDQTNNMKPELHSTKPDDNAWNTCVVIRWTPRKGHQWVSVSGTNASTTLYRAPLVDGERLTTNKERDLGDP